MSGIPEDLMKEQLKREVRIIGTSQIENYTVYTIQISVSDCHWTVKHRYSEFCDLHEKLVATKRATKSQLPPKKVFGNTSKSFIEKRRSELEVYLQKVLDDNRDLPQPLLMFLEFDIYDIFGVAQALAAELYEKGDIILSGNDMCEMTPMQLYAITERLKLPLPTCGSQDARNDIGHIMDFLATLKYLRVAGSPHNLGTSNRKVIQLPFDLSHFRVMEKLQIDLCNMRLISGLGEMKGTLRSLSVHKSAPSIKEILLSSFGNCDEMDSESIKTLITAVPPWTAVTKADFRYNNMQKIDESICLLPRVEHLTFSHNNLTGINNLEHLSSLNYLDLSHNAVERLENMHVKLGNITTLNLSYNLLQSLEGLGKLYSLVNLDVGHNSIEKVDDVRSLEKLPCLETLVLFANPVTGIVDYRTKILKLFGDRVAEVTLDGQPASIQETDTVAILSAIQKSKLNQNKRSTKSHEVAILENPSVASARTTSKTDNLSPLEGNDFQAQIKKIREEGGKNWLNKLNELQAAAGKSNQQLDQQSGSQSDRQFDKQSNRQTERLPEVVSVNPVEEKIEKEKKRETQSDIPVVQSLAVTASRNVSTIPTTEPTQADTQISPRALAHCLFDELARHKAHGIHIVSDLFTNLYIFFKGPVLCTYGTRHRLTDQPHPNVKGSTIVEILNSMESSQQKEFVNILKGLAEGSAKLYNPIHPSQHEAAQVYEYVLQLLNKELVKSIKSDPVQVKQELKPVRNLDTTAATVGTLAITAVTTAVTTVTSDVTAGTNAITAGTTASPVETTATSAGITVTAVETKVMTDTPTRKSDSDKSVQTVLPPQSKEIPEYEKEMLEHLSSCNKTKIVAVPEAMEFIQSMSATELVKFFHENVAQISLETERLLHVMWSTVITFAAPKVPVVAMVMLSCKAIYFVSQTDMKFFSESSNGKVHRRIRSDFGVSGYTMTFKSGQVAQPHQSGVLHTTDTSGLNCVRCQHKIDLSDIREVFAGLFNQKLRITGPSADTTVTLLTQNFQLTKEFHEELMKALPSDDSKLPHSPDPEGGDIYNQNSQLSEQQTGLTEYVHPSNVTFYYQNEEAIEDLRHVLSESLSSSTPDLTESTMLFYRICYKTFVGELTGNSENMVIEPWEQEMCSLFVINQHIALCNEDHVSYPLPSFIRALPETVHYHLIDAHSIRNLKRIVLSDFTSKDITLIFEVLDVDVDISKDHFSATVEGAAKQETPDVAWTVILPTQEDRERVVKMLSTQWKEIHNGQLSIQVSA